MQPRKEVINNLIIQVKAKVPLLVIGFDNDLIYDIHNFYPKKYYKSIDHMGFGVFKGYTEHGKFTFCAGGALYDVGRWEDNKKPSYIAYTSLSIDNNDVLKDLGYDYERMEKALNEELEKVIKID